MVESPAPADYPVTAEVGDFRPDQNQIWGPLATVSAFLAVIAHIVSVDLTAFRFPSLVAGYGREPAGVPFCLQRALSTESLAGQQRPACYASPSLRNHA